MPNRPGARDWVWIAVLMGVWGVAFAAAVVDGVHSARSRIRITAVSAPAGGHPVIGRVRPQLRRRAGQRPGDVLLALDGQDLRGASAIRFYLGADRAVRERGRVVLRVDRAGELIESVVEPSPDPTWYLALLFPVALIAAASSAPGVSAGVWRSRCVIPDERARPAPRSG